MVTIASEKEIEFYVCYNQETILVSTKSALNWMFLT